MTWEPYPKREYLTNADPESWMGGTLWVSRHKQFVRYDNKDTQTTYIINEDIKMAQIGDIDDGFDHTYANNPISKVSELPDNEITRALTALWYLLCR